MMAQREEVKDGAQQASNNGRGRTFSEQLQKSPGSPPHLRGGDSHRHRQSLSRSRRSRDPYAISARRVQAGAAAPTADDAYDPEVFEDRRTPPLDDDYEKRPKKKPYEDLEDGELSIPYKVVVPDSLKYAKRREVYKYQLLPDPVTRESKVIPPNWQDVYEPFGLGAKHIHVLERLGIDESLVKPVEEIVVVPPWVLNNVADGLNAPPGTDDGTGIGTDTGADTGAVATIAAQQQQQQQQKKTPFWKPWQREPFNFMKNLGFTSWTMRSGSAIRLRYGLSKELGGDDGWVPARLSFLKDWPAEEDEDVWFRMCYTHLFLRIDSFSKKYFDLGDILTTNPYHRKFIWLEGFPKEFLWYVKKVAKPDNEAGGWDGLLIYSTYRTALVTAVIAKILETHVFDELLFGDNRGQHLMLESQDKHLIELEGYQRSELRARTVRATLRGKTLTPHFWSCVDELSTQITSMLVPLVKVLDKHFMDSNLNSIRSLHQDIHAIVAEAAYFSIAVSWSHDIFRFSSPFLGQVWDMDQAHFDDGPWKLSKASSDAADKKARDDYDRAVQAAQDKAKNQAKKRANVDKSIKDTAEQNYNNIFGGIKKAIGVTGEAYERWREAFKEEFKASSEGRNRDARKFRGEREALRASINTASDIETAAIDGLADVFQRKHAQDMARERDAEHKLATAKSILPYITDARDQKQQQLVIGAHEAEVRERQHITAASKRQQERELRTLATKEYKAAKELEAQALEAAKKQWINRIRSWLPRRRIPFFSKKRDEDDPDGPVTYPDPPIQSSRLAKVQMVLWPMLQRYSPLGPLDPETRVCKEGETIVRISKSQVIYYAGYSAKSQEKLEKTPTLDAHLKSLRRQRIWAWFWPLFYALLAVLTWDFGHFLGDVLPSQFGWLSASLGWIENSIRTGLEYLAWAITRGVTISAINLLIWLLQALLTMAKLLFWFVYALRNSVGKWTGVARPSSPYRGMQFAHPASWVFPTVTWGGLAWPEPRFPLPRGDWDEAKAAAAGALGGVAYPEFSWDAVRNMFGHIWGEVVWRYFEFKIPYPSYRPAVPALTALDFGLAPLGGG